MPLSSVQFFKEERQRAEQRAWFLRLLSTTSMLSTLVVATAVLVYSYTTRRTEVTRARTLSITDQLKDLSAEINKQKQIAADLQAQTERTLQASASLTKSNENRSYLEAFSVKVSELTSRQDAISKRMEALEGSLLNTPEKALALPLLRQQLSDSQDGEKNDVTSLRAEIGGVQTTANWALGLLITLIISLFGLLGIQFFRKPLDEFRDSEKAK